MTRRFDRSAGLTAIAVAGFLSSILGWDHASAQASSDVTALGRSAASGAVCQAVRDYQDPLAQRPSARAWAVRCLGWDLEIGRLYRLPDEKALADWRQAFASRAACQKPRREDLAGLSGAERSLCRSLRANLPYVLYTSRRGRFIEVAEGFAQTADVLETGLRVIAGAMAPPAIAQSQTSKAAAAIAAEFGGDLAGLAGAEKAATTDAGLLIARGYVQNSEWRFQAAEADFRTLAATAQSQNAPPGERALALLNLALNVSNAGRFDEASGLLDEADGFVAASGDQALRAEALNYRANHLRNQRLFAEAAAMAERALAARAQARGSASFSTAAAQIRRASDDHTIDESLADSLNVRSAASGSLGADALSPEVRLALQDVEALEIQGSCLLALKDAAAAAMIFDKARAALQFAEERGAETSALRARVEADVGDLDLAAGRARAAVDRYGYALGLLRLRHAGSPPEGGLLLDLGRAEAAAGNPEAALETYDRAFAVFKSARGSLGDSADEAEPFLDLLIALGDKQPDRAAGYAARFFAAVEAVVSDATASTISRLAARVASGDEVTAGLVRAVDDTRREVASAEGRISALQAQNAYVGDAKAAADADLQQKRAELAAVNAELLNANPRYDQLVSSAATLADLQKALRPDEVYVKTLLLGDRGYGLLVSRDEAIPYAIPMSGDALVSAALKLRGPMEGAGEGLEDFDVAGSYALFQTLFGPVAQRMLKARSLIYEPDGKLVSLPVGLFVTDPKSAALVAARGRAKGAPADYRGVAWLGARLNSSLVLSATAFLQARAFPPSHARRLFAGFADPDLARSGPRAYAALLSQGDEELARTSGAARAAKICDASRRALLRIEALPDTEKEVRVVAGRFGAGDVDIVTGQAFDDASLRARKDLADYKILYFATHALLPMPDACLPEPALLTSLGAGDSQGLLDASDIVKLKLDAELIVLSACDTGGGSNLAGGGESLGGLTRAFIYAGARGLIVSHWAVDSAATERLMTGLFASGAASEAAALQDAQAAMQADPSLSHPYFWAPFTIVGDGARPIPSDAVQTKTAHVPAGQPSS